MTNQILPVYTISGGDHLSGDVLDEMLLALSSGAEAEEVASMMY